VTLAIAPAARQEAADVFAVLDEAAAYLQQIGVSEQWPPSFSADPAWAVLLRRLVGRGLIQVAHEAGAAGAAVGVFYLGDRPNPDGAAAARGVARAMLDWAAGCATTAGLPLRLDCWAGNNRLRRFYHEAGCHKGDVQVTSLRDGRTYAVSRFERSDVP
jgi:hypothetical protein